MLIMISLHEVKQITPINAVKVLGLILVTPVTWRSNYCLDKSIGFNPRIIIQRLCNKYLELRIIDSFFRMELSYCLSKYPSPESSDVIEVSDSSTDFFVVPCSSLGFVLDDIILDLWQRESVLTHDDVCDTHLTLHITVIGPRESHWGRGHVRHPDIAWAPG